MRWAIAALIGLLIAVYGWMDWQSSRRSAAMARRAGADIAAVGAPWWLYAGLLIAAVGTVGWAVSRRDVER